VAGGVPQESVTLTYSKIVITDNTASPVVRIVYLPK
jgi:hypothetical protein